MGASAGRKRHAAYTGDLLGGSNKPFIDVVVLVLPD